MHAEGDVHEEGWLTVGAGEGGEGDEEGVSDGSGPKISCSYRIVLCISRFCFFVNAKILHRATHLLGLYQLSISYPARLRVSSRRYHCHKITTENCLRSPDTWLCKFLPCSCAVLRRLQHCRQRSDSYCLPRNQLVRKLKFNWVVG